MCNGFAMLCHEYACISALIFARRQCPDICRRLKTIEFTTRRAGARNYRAGNVTCRDNVDQLLQQCPQRHRARGPHTMRPQSTPQTRTDPPGSQSDLRHQAVLVQPHPLRCLVHHFRLHGGKDVQPHCDVRNAQGVRCRRCRSRRDRHTESCRDYLWLLLEVVAVVRQGIHT